MKKICLFFISALFFLTCFSQDEVLGKWKTIDDETGRVKSIVELYKKGDKLFGKVIKLFRLPDEDQDPKCDKCDLKDPRYNQRVLGMEIIKDMIWDDDEWDDGYILDPKKGKVYDCKLWLEEGELQVRGYIVFFFRTQTWVRPTKSDL